MIDDAGKIIKQIINNALYDIPRIISPYYSQEKQEKRIIKAGQYVEITSLYIEDKILN